MTGLIAGTAYQLQYEAAGAGNRNDTHSGQHHHPGASSPMTASRTPQAHRKAQLISSIRQTVAEMVLTTGNNARVKNSNYLSYKLSHDYTYLANLFSEATGSTIEQYIIEFKIDRVKELLTSGKLSLTQIAYQLNYSSVAHLSNQFKKVTGLTPSSFKTLQSRHGIMPESGNDVTVFCNRVNTPEVRRVSFAM